VADPVRIERDGAIASLVLSDPPLNLFGEATFRSLATCMDEVEAADDIRTLVWRAEGDVFTGGVDVNVFAQTKPEDADEVFAALLRIVNRIEALPYPTLALVNGLCLTAGLELSLGCDMIWAAESAQFGLVERVVGLTPGAGGTQRMAERAGPAKAREFVMTGGLYPAATLEQWNVVNRVLPDGDLQEKGMAFAQKLADGPTKAHAATKHVIRGWLDGGIEEADRRTPSASGGLFQTEDLQSAVKSFLEEGPGKAKFEGR
jgi:enoyl-CoA hydratase/carnithine racemase